MNFLSLIKSLIEPKSQLFGTEDYFKSKLFNAIFFILTLISFFDFLFRVILIFIQFNDPTINSVTLNSLFICLLVLGFFLIGRTSFYKIGFKTFPLIPLISVWTYYPVYTSNAVQTELFVFNPESILMFGLIIGGFLYSIRGIILFSLISIFDMILFYGLISGFSFNWIESRLLTLVVLSGLLIVYVYCRIISFHFLSETNKQLSNEVEIKDKNLFEERSQLYSLVATLKEGVLIINNEKIPLLVNTQFNNLFEEITGKKFNINSEFGSDFEKENPLIEFISKLFKIESYSEIIQNKTKFFLLIFNKLHISSNDSNSRILIEIHDITQMKIIEMVEKRIHLVLMHELRTPATTLSLAISNLLKYENRLSNENRQLIYKTIKQQSDDLNFLVSKISSLTFFENSASQKFPVYDLYSILNNIKLELKKQRDLHDIEVIESIDNDSYFITIDQDSLFIVLKNVLDNAIKFSKKDTSIFIRFFIQELSYFVIEIIDYGIGIPVSDIRDIFTRFFKAKNADNYPGIGVGLSVSYEIIHSNNGNILIKSKENFGTTVRIILPVFQKYNYLIWISSFKIIFLAPNFIFL